MTQPLSFVRFALLLSLVLLVPGAIAAKPPARDDGLLKQPGVLSAEFIYETAPFPECHASTIAQTNSGLVTAWFGGTEEKHPDVGIWVSRQVDGQWTPPREVANGVQFQRPDGSVLRHPCWNPVLFQPRKGPLLLFFKCGPDPRTWWGMLTTSDDDGQTWSTPRRLPEGIAGPVKNKPVQLADGSIVCPSSSEDDGWRLHLEVTKDLGATWTRIGPLNDGKEIGAIQPSILFHNNGDWQILARDRNGQGNIWTTWSKDNGLTWTELTSSGLPNPNAGTDAVTLADGRQLLVYNHSHRGESSDNTPTDRGLLEVAVSDDGRTWQAAVELERAPGEYSYPAVIQTKDGLVHITYTWNRQKIKHVVLDPPKLKPAPIRDGQWPQAKQRAS